MAEKKETAKITGSVFIFLDDERRVNPDGCFKAEVAEEKITLITVPIRKYENMLDQSRHPEERLHAMEMLHEEIIGKIPEGNLPYLLGYDIGAYIGATLFFKQPDLFRGGIFLSGLYQIQDILKDYRSDKAYLNSPVEFLANLENADAFRCFLRSKLIFMTGRGEGTELANNSLHHLDNVLLKRSIPAFIDYWGYDVTNAPVWWEKQFKYGAKLILR